MNIGHPPHLQSKYPTFSTVFICVCESVFSLVYHVYLCMRTLCMCVYVLTKRRHRTSTPAVKICNSLYSICLCLWVSVFSFIIFKIVLCLIKICFVLFFLFFCFVLVWFVCLLLLLFFLVSCCHDYGLTYKYGQSMSQKHKCWDTGCF